MIAGLVHPGEMGASIGNALRGNGHDVIWASEGRSDATRARAEAFRDVVSPAVLFAESDLVVSVCPPHAALDVARATGGFDGLYVDANAISPAKASAIAALHPRFVDGGIIGSPSGPHLYLSGDEAPAVAALFAGSHVDARVTSDASALKMVYAAWTKGSAALLLATHATARAYGVADALAAEWDQDDRDRLEHAERSAAAKGWRWTGEMDEIADTFAAAGQPDGFHRAAAEVYRP